MNKMMLAAAAACVAGGISAATNEVGTLETVTVYASRIDDTRDALPASAQIYGADAIAESGARDLPDFLRKKAGLDVRAISGIPVQSAIQMRGFGENGFGRVKVVLDGEELNNVDMVAPNLMRVPLGSAERIEVIHGPSPVLHGDGAVAGVVNATTDTRDYAQRTRVTATAGSQETFGANVSTRGGDEGNGVQYGGAYDYLTSDGYRDRSGYDIHTADASVRKNYDNGSTAAVKAAYQSSSYELPGSLPAGEWRHDRKSAANQNDRCRTWAYSLGFDSKLLVADDQWLLIDAGFGSQFRHAHYESFYGKYDYEYDYRSFWLSPRYVNEQDVFGLADKFTFGGDFRFDRYEKEVKTGSDFGMGGKTGSRFDRDRFAAFVRDELFISDDLSLIAGARAERIGNSWKDDPAVSDPDTFDLMGDFELGLVYRPTDKFRTYARGTRFHRSAFCDEMNYTQDGKMLDPETGFSLDIGFEWEFAEEFTLDANAYGSAMDDEIFYNPYATPSPFGGWNGYNANSPDETRRLGLDCGISWLRDGVAEAAVRYSAVKAEFGGGRYDGEDIPLVPNHRVRAEAGVWIVDDLEIKGGFSHVGPQYLAGDFDNANGTLGSYSLFDVGAYYAPSWAEGWKASVVIDNLLDRKYCDFAGWSDYTGAYYYPACGRSVLFSLSCEW